MCFRLRMLYQKRYELRRSCAYHPKTSKAGLYHAVWVSSMNNVPEIMKPVPPRICGDQKMPSRAGWERRLLTLWGWG